MLYANSIEMVGKQDCEFVEVVWLSVDDKCLSGPLDVRVGSGYAISVLRLRFGCVWVDLWCVFKLVRSPPSAQRVVSGGVRRSRIVRVS